MDPERRKFLAGGLAAGIGGLSYAGRLGADVISDELQRRLKYLATPDGIPADAKFGVPFHSPDATPFRDKLFVPPVAKPEIDMTGPEWDIKDNDVWWKKFEESFWEKTAEYLARGINIGGLPVPEAHQRFFEYRPKKFYIMLEREVLRHYHSDYGKVPNCWTWCYELLCEDRAGTTARRPSSPGPTFNAVYGEPVLVRRVNDLREVGNHRGTLNIKFALPSTTTHLHNAHTGSESDGNPNDFINPTEYWDHHYANFPSGHDDREKLTTLWYHDHRMDYTAANVYAGLDGFWRFFDPRVVDDGEPLAADEMQDVGSETEEEGWRLPYGKNSEFDIPLMLHDLLFEKDQHGAPQLIFDGFNSNGVLGDRFTVNRVIQPYLEVKPRKYRFRIVNGGPSRFYDLALHTRNDRADGKSTPAPQPFVVLTGDGNFQGSPLVTEHVYFGVSQRVDVIIDFSMFQDGDHVYLVNELRQTRGQGPLGDNIVRPADTAPPEDIDKFFKENSIMRFNVVGGQVEDNSQIRLTYRELPEVDLTEVVRERVWEFDEDGGLWTVNGRIFDGNRIDAGIEEGTAELWTMRNAGNNWLHPIHSHFTEFIVLEIDGRPQYQVSVQTGKITHHGSASQRTLINAEDVENKLRRRLSGRDPLKGLNPKLRGSLEEKMKSTYDVTRREAFQGEELDRVVASAARYYTQMTFGSVQDFLDSLTSIEGEFGVNLVVPRFFGGPRRDIAVLFPGTEIKMFMRWRDFRGKYVMHCHNVVHEDHAMMVRWEIVPRGEGFDSPRRAPQSPGQPPARPYAEPHPGQTTAQPGTIPDTPPLTPRGNRK